jgi:hypothetical protein
MVGGITEKGGKKLAVVDLELSDEEEGDPVVLRQ